MKHNTFTKFIVALAIVCVLAPVIAKALILPVSFPQPITAHKSKEGGAKVWAVCQLPNFGGTRGGDSLFGTLKLDSMASSELITVSLFARFFNLSTAGETMWVNGLTVSTLCNAVSSVGDGKAVRFEIPSIATWATYAKIADSVAAGDSVKSTIILGGVSDE
jgi:hypothetical protein